ncbi:MAG TPA: NAD(P)-dependent oxidoreductase [Chloroflexota bacterium]|nr:NAD(P)-dependent oxidoreductase [Chloroflexota bacterium]
MKIFVAGATGVMGRRLVPLLVAAGHEVVGTTRTGEKAGMLRAMGAVPAVVDAFDRAGLATAVSAAQPDVVMHQLTDLSARDSAANARVRIEGTRHLVDAARAAGVRRLIAQSIAWAYEPGPGPADEGVPLDTAAPEPRHTLVAGVQALETAADEIEGAVVLRYGLFYGPGTWYAPDGAIAEQVRRGEVTADASVSSFIHVDDAARAALVALDWPPGIVNVVDDEPAPGSVWLPVYAASLGAPAPRIGTGQERGARGASNGKARRQLGWRPLYPSWREGFVRVAEEWKSQAAARRPG